MTSNSLKKGLQAGRDLPRVQRLPDAERRAVPVLRGNHLSNADVCFAGVCRRDLIFSRFPV